MAEHSTTATIFCDASFTMRGAGYGVVARVGGRLVASSRRFKFDVPSSGVAEALSVLGALQICKKRMPELDRAVVHIDCLAVVEAMRRRRTTRGIGHIVHAVDDFVAEHMSRMDIKWVRGHSNTGTRGVANGIAHRLAWMGRHGESVDYLADFDGNWRRTLSDIDPRLVAFNDHDSVPFDRVGPMLGLPPGTVAELIQKGYLDYDSNGVTLHSMNMVAQRIVHMRAQAKALDQEAEAAPVLRFAAAS